MKLVLALLALTALTVSAHWTHDDSLAREIGPPPGEDDLEVGALDSTEELIQTGAKKTYRITFGTTVLADEVKGSMSQFQVSLKGAVPAAPAAGATSAWTEDTDWKTDSDAVIQYYAGSFMDYQKAKGEAPQLRPGMVPLIATPMSGCASLINGKMSPCPVNKAKELSPCEPMAKDCATAITAANVGYARGAMSALAADTSGDSAGKMGPIQRGQFKMDDVGKIIAVQIKELKDFSSSDPCMAGSSATFKQADCSSPWSPSFIKINTNDAQTGVGDGVYYIAPCDAANLKIGTYVESGGANAADTQKLNNMLTAKALPAGSSDCSSDQNAILTKCAAATCEEEMDTKLGMMDKSKYEFADIE